MRVGDLMQRHPRVARSNHTLVDASRTMAEVDCGVLPVLDGRERLVGILTDRDITLALASATRPPSDITIAEVMSTPVHTIGAGGNIHAALETMKRHRVRRLPVLDAAGALTGLLSLDDIAVEARELSEGSNGRPTFGEVAAALQVVNAHQLPAV